MDTSWTSEMFMSKSSMGDRRKSMAQKLWGAISDEKTRESAVQTAIYGGIVNGAILLVILLLVGAYFVLRTFLKPLLWAVLCGMALFPFKRKATTSVNSWLTELEKCNRPIVLGLVLLPFDVFFLLSSQVEKVIFTWKRTTVAVFMLTVSMWMFYRSPLGCIGAYLPAFDLGGLLESWSWCSDVSHTIIEAVSAFSVLWILLALVLLIVLKGLTVLKPSLSPIYYFVSIPFKTILGIYITSILLGSTVVTFLTSLTVFLFLVMARLGKVAFAYFLSFVVIFGQLAVVYGLLWLLVLCAEYALRPLHLNWLVGPVLDKMRQLSQLVFSLFVRVFGPAVVWLLKTFGRLERSEEEEEEESQSERGETPSNEEEDYVHDLIEGEEMIDSGPRALEVPSHPHHHQQKQRSPSEELTTTDRHRDDLRSALDWNTAIASSSCRERAQDSLPLGERSTPRPPPQLLLPPSSGSVRKRGNLRSFDSAMKSKPFFTKPTIGDEGEVGDDAKQSLSLSWSNSSLRSARRMSVRFAETIENFIVKDHSSDDGDDGDDDDGGDDSEGGRECMGEAEESIDGEKEITPPSGTRFQELPPKSKLDLDTPTHACATAVTVVDESCPIPATEPPLPGLEQDSLKSSLLSSSLHSKESVGGPLPKGNTSSLPKSSSDLPTIVESSSMLAGKKASLSSSMINRLSSLSRRAKQRARKQTTTQPVDAIFSLLFGACLMALLLMHDWMFLIFVLILGWILGKRLAGRQLQTSAHRLWDIFLPLIDGSIPGLLKTVITTTDKIVISTLKHSASSLVSVFIITLVVVACFSAPILIGFELYSEATHYLSVTANLTDRVLRQAGYEESGAGTTPVETLTQEGYQYARQWLKGYIEGIVVEEGVEGSSAPSPEATQLTEEFLAALDGTYETFFSSNQSAQSAAARQQSRTILSYAPWERLSLLLGENVKAVKSVLHRALAVVKDHIPLVSSLLRLSLGVVLHGGQALVNLLFSSIIFLSTLFYLLSHSGDHYLLTEGIMSLLPQQQSTTGTSRHSLLKAGDALTRAYRSVFLVTFKMALFYGLYTWLVHKLFFMEAAILPAVLAAVAAVVPLFSPYIACLPAVLELLVVDGDWTMALLLLLLHLVPAFYVDTAIYREIQGAHPYATALTIVGGAYLAGLEGAIFGPLLLCTLKFCVNVYQSKIAEF